MCLERVISYNITCLKCRDTVKSAEKNILHDMIYLVHKFRKIIFSFQADVFTQIRIFLKAEVKMSCFLVFNRPGRISATSTPRRTLNAKVTNIQCVCEKYRKSKEAYRKFNICM